MGRYIEIYDGETRVRVRVNDNFNASYAKAFLACLDATGTKEVDLAQIALAMVQRIPLLEDRRSEANKLPDQMHTYLAEMRNNREVAMDKHVGDLWSLKYKLEQALSLEVPKKKED